MILDSCFLIDLLAGDAAATAKLEEITGRLLAVPTIAYTEVAVGIDQKTAGGQQFDSVMDRVAIVSYTEEAARRAVDIQRDLLTRGEPIGAIDVMIAGTAVARDESIITRNATEFARTPARISPY